jgi:teichoic acid transport system permease protein
MATKSSSSVEARPDGAEPGASANAAGSARQHGREDEFTERHVYEPHSVGLPPLRSYVRELWKRRQFAFELARTNLRAKHFNTVFGQLWLILNGLLLGFVYFTLVVIIGRGSRTVEFIGHLLAMLFLFRFVSSSVSTGARSVVGGGQLILNTAFPRTLLPLSSVLTAFMAFLPMLGVYAVVHLILRKPLGPELVFIVPVVAIAFVFACGAAMLIATAQVYFRDLKSFLPYFTRIWLYTSPVLYLIEQIPERIKPVLMFNPMYPILGALSQVVDDGDVPSWEYLVSGSAWAVAVFILGGLFFISREREFAVRL